MLRLIIFFKPYSKYLLAAWMTAVITVSSIPSLPTLKLETEGSVIRLDYLIHFMEYGIMIVLALMAFSDRLFSMQPGKLVIVTAGIVLFAIVDEFHQKLIPGRSFNVKDILSNVTGITSGVIFYLLILKMLKKRLSESE
ncbi:MAG TPA: VanZ family protein [Bacteroidales bacterium]|nr:VanZ family protein [Bacteroidales bacterium]